VLSGFAPGGLLRAQNADKPSQGVDLDKIGAMIEVQRLLSRDHVDGANVDLWDLMHDGLEGTDAPLDRFTGLMDPAQYRDIKEDAEGKFGGLGIVVSTRSGALTVVRSLEDGPGDRAGLRPGDRIVRIGDESTQNLSLRQAVERLKGPPGTKVVVAILRPGASKTKWLKIKRAVVRVPSVVDEQTIDGSVGYLRIRRFDERTAVMLAKALKRLKKTDVAALVIDLRNNPGGTLSTVVDVCSLFLPPGKLVVSTETRRTSEKRQYFTSRKKRAPEVPLAILINHASASGAEIMAGCLRDWARAVLVGQRTFGKGSSQNVVKLPDGSALRLTVAVHRTPHGHAIDGAGIEPDVEVVPTYPELRTLARSHVAWWEEKAPNSLLNDRQLQRAIAILRERQGTRPTEDDGETRK